MVLMKLPSNQLSLHKALKTWNFGKSHIQISYVSEIYNTELHKLPLFPFLYPFVGNSQLTILRRVHWKAYKETRLYAVGPFLKH